MPTEDESTLPQTPPGIETSTSYVHCPPDLEREIHAPRESREQDLIAEVIISSDAEQHVSNAPDARAGALDQEQYGMREQADIIIADSPSAHGSPEISSDRDSRLARSAITAAKSSSWSNGEDVPMYLSYPPIGRRKPLQPNSTSSYLYPGSKFRGTQQSDRQRYDVQVEIKDVDLAESFLCGYLRIQGLTDDHPTLTTFFTSEIIGPKYTFRTAHPSWNSSEKIDLQHWSRFDAFRPLAKAAKSNPTSFTLKNYLERETLFMRWKEYFLVPDHRVKSITGASFEGFYYISFDQTKGEVKGIYFHAKSEKFQQLELKHVSTGGCVGAMEFR